MAEVTAHLPGTFSWPELATTDQKAAVSFYRSLFWLGRQRAAARPRRNLFDVPAAREGNGAACTLRPDERQAGVPPHWNAYVTVANADEIAKKAQELGAKVFAPPFDVMDAGRMAVLQDPTGAVFQVWQPKQAHRREDYRRARRALLDRAHHARHRRRPRRSIPSSSAGRRSTARRIRRMEYTEFSVGGTPAIGMMAKQAEMPAHMPSYWMPYFQVDDADASAAKAKELGGKRDGAADRHSRRRAASRSSTIRRARCSRSSNSRRVDVSAKSKTCSDALAGTGVTDVLEKTTAIPTKAEALPGRAERMPVPDAHFVNGHRLTPPFPDGLERARVRDGLLLGRGEEVLAAAPASTRRPSATPPATRRTRPTAKSAPA